MIVFVITVRIYVMVSNLCEMDIAAFKLQRR